MRALLDGKDVLAVLWTGCGKSLIYQMFAAVVEYFARLCSGMTVIRSVHLVSLPPHLNLPQLLQIQPSQ